MRDAKSRSVWKRALFALLKVYAGLCTLLVTAVLAFILWEVIPTQPPSAQGHQNQLTSAEGEPKELDLTLSYDLPKVPRTFDGPFQVHAAGTSASQPDGAADGSQPFSSVTNRAAGSAGSRR